MTDNGDELSTCEKAQAGVATSDKQMPHRIEKRKISEAICRSEKSVEDVTPEISKWVAACFS